MEPIEDLVRKFEEEYYKNLSPLSIERLQQMRQAILEAGGSHIEQCQHCGYFLAAIGMDLRDFEFVLSTLKEFELRTINRLTKQWMKLQILEWTASSSIWLGNDKAAIPLILILAKAHKESNMRPTIEYKNVDGEEISILRQDPTFPDSILNAAENKGCSDECKRAIIDLVRAGDLEKRYSKYNVIK